MTTAFWVVEFMHQDYTWYCPKLVFNTTVQEVDLNMIDMKKKKIDLFIDMKKIT